MTQKPENATDQATPKAGKGGVVPPTSKQFGKPGGNPRNPGGWKKEDTPRYKLEQMMKLNVEELTAIVKNPKTPLFEIRMANAIKNGDWKVIDGMISQVYGKPSQTVDMTSGGEKVNVALVRFADGTERNTDTST